MSVNDGQPVSIAQTIHGRSKQHPTTSVDSIEENNGEENDSGETNIATITAAEAFMHSTTDYPTTKRWFENWLLPRLNLTPESTIKDWLIKNNRQLDSEAKINDDHSANE